MGCENSSLIEYSQASQHEQFKMKYQQFVGNTPGKIYQMYRFSSILNKSSKKIIRQIVHRIHQTVRVCKIIPFSKTSQIFSMIEVETLRKLQHPNIVRIHQYFIEQDYLYIVLENIEGIPILKKLQERKEITENNFVDIMKQLLTVLNYLHENDIAHRNIHPNHILLQFDTNKLLIKLIDFSYACDTHEKAISQMKLNKIPTFFQKIYNSEEADKNPKQHDIYCCGLILLNILGGREFMPKNRDTRPNIKGLVEKYPRYTIYQNILQKMLNPDPMFRSNPKQLLEDKVFKEVNQNSQNIRYVLQNVMNFNYRGKLKSTLWMYTAINLKNYASNPLLITEFYNLDKNKDGKIDIDELTVSFMNTFKIDQNQARIECQKVFKKLDINQNGYLDFYEFILGNTMINKKLTEEEFKFIFQELDKNNDNIISRQDLNECIQGLEGYKFLDLTQKKFNYEQFKLIMKDLTRTISEQNMEQS